MAGARVLVIDDEADVRRTLDLAFRQEGYQVRTEADGSGLREVAGEFRPDVAVIDLRLPKGPDGYAMARMLRQADDDIPVLLLTAADSVESRLSAFEAGVDDHVGKPFSTAEVLARTQALLRRSGRAVNTTPLTVGDLVIDDATHRVTRGDHLVELTRTEYDVLSLLARHTNQVLSKQQLLIRLWDFDAYDPNLIEVHVSALRHKLEAYGPRVIHTVRSVGYVLRN